MTIGEKLAWYRTRAGHTQESLALAAGISRKRISEIEGNKGSPNLDTLEALLKACGASLAEFFAADASTRAVRAPYREIYERIGLLLKTPDDARMIDRLVRALLRDQAKADAEGTAAAGRGTKSSEPQSPVRLLGHDLPQPAKFVKVPYYERVPAGDPVQLSLDQSFWMDILHSSAKPGWYALRISGDSMLPEYRDGDIVLMDHDEAPKNGDIVAALIDGSESTLKEYRCKDDEITLTPLNRAKYKPRKYHASRVAIQGVLVELVRRSPKRARQSSSDLH